jgi:bla regulator protein blaR1
MTGIVAFPAATEQVFSACFSMLLHSLWLGLVISIILAVFLYARPQLKSVTRYAVLLAGFFLFLAGCGFFFAAQLSLFSPAEIPAFSAPVSASFAPVNLDSLSALSSWVVWMWFVAITCLSVRSWISFTRYRSSLLSVSQAPPLYWSSTLTELAKKMGLQKSVRLLESFAVSAPVLIGHLKPVILVPAGFLASLPPDQLEAVLLHELAHVRRADFAVNLLQCAAEIVFFFNPGLLWLSAMLREEREHCCDELALRHLPERMSFVHALITVKEYTLLQNSYALPFFGVKNQLLGRIGRILGKPQPLNYASAAGKVAVAGIITLLLITGMDTIRSQNLSGYRPYSRRANTSPGLTESIHLKSAQDTLRTPGKSRVRAERRLRKTRAKDELPANDAAAKPIVVSVADATFPDREYREDMARYAESQLEYRERMARYAEAQREYRQRMTRYAQSQQEYQQQMTSYAQSQQEYQQRMSRYQTKMEEYRLSLEQYNRDMAEYNREMLKTSGPAAP